MDPSRPAQNNQNARQEGGDVTETVSYPINSKDFIAGTRGEKLRRLSNRTGALVRFIYDRSTQPGQFVLQFSGSWKTATITQDLALCERYWNFCTKICLSCDYHDTWRCCICDYDRCVCCEVFGNGRVSRELQHAFTQCLRFLYVVERRRNEISESKQTSPEQGTARPTSQIENLVPATNIPTELPPKIFISRTISQDVTPADQTPTLFIARTISQDLTGSDASNTKHLLCALRDRPSGLKISSKRLFREEIGSGIGKRGRL